MIKIVGNNWGCRDATAASRLRVKLKRVKSTLDYFQSATKSCFSPASFRDLFHQYLLQNQH